MESAICLELSSTGKSLEILHQPLCLTGHWGLLAVELMWPNVRKKLCGSRNGNNVAPYNGNDVTPRNENNMWFT